MKALSDILITLCGLYAACAVLLVCLFFCFRICRFGRIRFHYFIDVSLGKEPNDGISIEYHEKKNTIVFVGNNNDYIIRIPDERLWQEIMPAWIQFRRTEIKTRIQMATSRGPIKLVECGSRVEGLSILHLSRSAKDQRRVTSIA